MNIPQGPWYIDDLLTFTVITTVFSTGVATDADAVPAYRVYEDETGTPILTGNMALLDSANTAGLYSEQITLSAANGFEVGKTYSIHVAATVSSVAGATSGGFKVIAVLASPTNITAGVITTVTNLTNAPTNGDLTATMKTSVTTAATAATPIAASVTGAVGSVVGLTASNLDTTVSSRMATYTQPTGFLAATFPGGTLANTTNITAGTLTTVTNLTNAATAGDFTATMKTSLNAATPVVTVSGVTFPSNFASLEISAAGKVTVGKMNATTVNGDGSAGNPWGP